MARLLPRRTGIAVLELHGVLETTIRAPLYNQILDRLERSSRIGAVLLDTDGDGRCCHAVDTVLQEKEERKRRHQIHQR